MRERRHLLTDEGQEFPTGGLETWTSCSGDFCLNLRQLSITSTGASPAQAAPVPDERSYSGVSPVCSWRSLFARLKASYDRSERSGAIGHSAWEVAFPSTGLPLGLDSELEGRSFPIR